MAEIVQVYDTTLRDGSQQAGISFSARDKVKIAVKLAELGIPYIEGGWPGSNPKDMEFFRLVRGMRLSPSRIVAFGSTRRKDLAAEDDPQVNALLEAETPVVTVVGKAWDFHVSRLMAIPLSENLAMIEDTVRYLKGHGREVIFDAEHFFDGYRLSRSYALQTLLAAEKGGADWIVLCDTNGGLMPGDVERVIREVSGSVRTPLGFHGHNDSGVAVANTLLAVQAGVRHVQGTINGYGERCGNANLCAVIPVLQLRLGFRCLGDGQLQKLTALSRYVAEVANMSPDERQPFVGENAFAHKAGFHVSAVMKDVQSYEHISPDLVGNRRRILVSELSGKSNVLHKLGNRIALDRDGPEALAVLNRVKVLECEGYQFEGAEASFEMLVQKTLNAHQALFSLLGFRVIVEKREEGEAYAEATIKVKVGDQVVLTAAEGEGPVNALDNALRKALEGIYPAIRGIKLADYKVRVLDGQDGTAAKVRVLIESRDDRGSWGTVGVSTNIIEASWQALVDSIEYGLKYRGTDTG